MSRAKSSCRWRSARVATSRSAAETVVVRVPESDRIAGGSWKTTTYASRPSAATSVRIVPVARARWRGGASETAGRTAAFAIERANRKETVNEDDRRARVNVTNGSLFDPRDNSGKTREIPSRCYPQKPHDRRSSQTHDRRSRGLTVASLAG